MKEIIHRGALLWPSSSLFLRQQCFQNWTIDLILISWKFSLTFAFHYNISS